MRNAAERLTHSAMPAARKRAGTGGLEARECATLKGLPAGGTHPMSTLVLKVCMNGEKSQPHPTVQCRNSWAGYMQTRDGLQWKSEVRHPGRSKALGLELIAPGKQGERLSSPKIRVWW